VKTFAILGKIIRYTHADGWHFVYVSKDISQKIRDTYHAKKKSAAFVRLRATVGDTTWTTSLFPTKDGPYLLAIKADVREKEVLDTGDSIKVTCTLL